MGRYITNSETAVMRRCQRKWYLTYYRRLSSRAETVSETRTIGILAHDAVAEYYNENQDPLAAVTFLGNQMIAEQEDLLVPGVNEAIAMRVEQNVEAINKAIDFASIIVEGYIEWLEETGEDQHLQLVATETEQQAPLPIDALPRPVILLGKFDARFIDHRSNARVFMDHKVVQNFPDREKWAHLDTQFRFYGLIEYLNLLVEGMDQNEAQGSWTDGGILNMLRKVKRTARSTPPFYKRKEVRHSIIELRNFFKRTVGEANRILYIEDQLDAGIDHMTVCPPNPSSDCTWDCSFMTLCAFMDDGSDADGYIEASFSVGNPLKRYATVEGLVSNDG